MWFDLGIFTGIEQAHSEPSSPLYPASTNHRSASPDKWIVKGYPPLHEATYLRASFDRRRAQDPGGGIALASKAFTLRRCQILLSPALMDKTLTRSPAILGVTRE
jgi:hypothetical protein